MEKNEHLPIMRITRRGVLRIEGIRQHVRRSKVVTTKKYLLIRRRKASLQNEDVAKFNIFRYRKVKIVLNPNHNKGKRN